MSASLKYTVGLGPASISFPNLPPQNLGPETAALGQLIAAELVVINSSTPRGVGPYPRTVGRKKTLHKLPRSPHSPTLRIVGSIPRLPRKQDHLPTAGE